MKSLLLLLISLLVFTGCAAKRDFSQLPVIESDFRLPAKELEEKFPEINLYKAGQPKIGWCTPVEQLETLWGKPDEINTVWLQMPLLSLPIALVDGVTTGGLIAAGMVYAMMPKQPKHYIWKKGNYSIDAYVTTGVFCDYKAHVAYWHWLERAN